MLDLQSFMDRVGATQQDVSEGSGVSQATVSRIVRAEIDPRASDVFAIQAWATEIAKKKRLLREERLSWAYLFDE